MRPWQAWSIFVLLAAVLMSAMGWTSSAVLRLDRVQAQIDRQANLEVRVRLALWRMESVLTPLIAREAARPYAVYNAPPEPTAGGGATPHSPSLDPLAPWALQNDTSAHVVLYFQLGADGSLTSPQLPAARPLTPAAATREVILRQRIVTLKSQLDYTQLETLMAHRDSLRDNFTVVAENRPGLPTPGSPVFSDAQQEAEYQRRLSMSTQNILDSNEESLASAANEFTTLSLRELAALLPPGLKPGHQPYDLLAPAGLTPRLEQEKQAVIRALSGPLYLGPRASGPLGRSPLKPGPAGLLPAVAGGTTSSAPALAGTLPPYQIGLPKPVWAGDSLLLVRRVTINGKQYFQGCWLDWIVLSYNLLTEVRDLLPEAVLEPVKEPVPIGRDRMLAALPARLIPGRIASAESDLGYPVLLSLRLAWSGVVLALGALAALLAGAMALSERRRTFVSAVTHELRTPLTTFRMYTEMLASGMIHDEQKQARYLATLQAEAGRLTHLVENVLAYARLEAGRTGSRAEELAVSDLLDRVTPRPAARAQQAQLELEIAMEDPAMQVRADVTVVEQILFNLFDNACKYAAAGPVRTIRIETRRQERLLALRILDHGPGIALREGRHLFRPFNRSARDAAGNAPGVGLGLALSRRLARAMGGDLKLDPAHTGPGACFVLTLPRCEARED